MIDERSLQTAAAALEKNWLELATGKELDLLEASGRRPDLFEKPDDAELRIVMHPSLAEAYGDDVREGNAIVIRTGPPDPKAMEAAADLVTRRIRLRARLRLPADDCGARKPNRECTCLSLALDECGEDADRAAIVANARKRHIRRRPFRARHAAKPKPLTRVRCPKRRRLPSPIR
jgi:hypothetical protein